MKLITARATLLLSALAITLMPLHAQPVAGTGYIINGYYPDTTSSGITAFAWNSGNLYYETASGAGFTLYQANIASPSSAFAITSTGTYPGSSIVSSGSYLFFNDGSNNIYSYNTTLGGTAVSFAANIPSYSMGVNGGNLYMAGGTPSYTTNISVTGISGGTLTSPGAVIESDGNYAGPLVFDSAGNLYYAPGGSGAPDATTNVVYKWTAAEVSAATPASPLTLSGSNVWFNYSLDYGSYAGVAGMAIDGNQLTFTLTNFNTPSVLSALVGVNINSDGTAGSSLILATDPTAGYSNYLSQLEVYNGVLYVNDGNEIYAVTPEPSTYTLLVLGLVGIAFFRYRKRVRPVPITLAAISAFFFR